MERPTLVRSAEGDEVADRAAGSKAVTTRVLVVSGSERRGSLNARLASLAAQVAAAQGAQVRRLDLRALVALRGLLGQVLGMVVVPQQQAVPLAHQAFDDEGRLREPRLQQGLE